MADAYFVNCLTEIIAVNLNNSLSNSVVPSTTIESLSVASPVAKYPVSANLAKDVFGNSGENKITIYFESGADASAYYISVSSSLAREDLFFYIFADGVVGKNDKGYGQGITISTLVNQSRTLQAGSES